MRTSCTGQIRAHALHMRSRVLLVAHPLPRLRLSFALSLFPTIRRLCDHLLRLSDARCQLVAVKMQSACFAAFTAAADRAIILDAFVAQIGQRLQDGASDAALAELWHLVQRDAEGVRAHSERIYTLVDYMHTFRDEQIRLIADVIAVVAVRQVRANYQQATCLERRECDDATPLACSCSCSHVALPQRVDEETDSVVLSVSDKYRIICSKHLHSSVVSHHRIGVFFHSALLKYLGGVVLDPECRPAMRGANAADLFTEVWRDLSTLLARMNNSHADTRRTQLYDEIATAIEAECMHADVLDIVRSETEEVLDAYLRSLEGPLRLDATASKDAQEACTPGQRGGMAVDRWAG